MTGSVVRPTPLAAATEAPAVGSPGAPGRTAATTRGFSLLELLLVVAIIGILMGMYMGVLSRAIGKAKQVASSESLRQTHIGRLADNANAVQRLRPEVTREKCRDAYRAREEISTGEVLVTEMLFRVDSNAEFVAYWNTLINPDATGPLEYEGGALVARDPYGNRFLLTPLTQDGWSSQALSGTFPIMWEFLSIDLSETTLNGLGVNVLYSDGHVGYVRYGTGFPATPIVAELSHRFVQVYGR